jgi:hypothetical protein
MHDHDEDEGFYPEDEFATGDDVILESDRGLELGFLLGFSAHGVIWRRTHKRVVTGPEPEDWEYAPLQKSILTFTRWELVNRLESHDDVSDDHELGMFSELMSDIADGSDFEAMVEAAQDDEA